MERFFRYVRTKRANAWKQAGWSVISGPLSMQPPVGLDATVSAIDVMIVEWRKPGQPVEPSDFASACEQQPEA
jgi:hypothetical protein